MIRIINEKEIENLKDYTVMVPSCDEVYYKHKYLNKDAKVVTIRNFLLSNYKGLKKLLDKNQNYVVMYEAFKRVKDKLNLYANVSLDTSFIKELIKTYDLFYEYDLKDDEKIKDLKLIYSSYEELLKEKGLINERLLFESVNDEKLDGTYLFLGLKDIDSNVFSLIKKMDRCGTVFIENVSLNKTLMEKLVKIDSSLSFKAGKINTKKVGYKVLNDVSDEVSFVSNDIAKKIMEGNSYSDFLIVSNNINAYEPYFDTLLNHPYTKPNQTGVLTSRFINIFSNLLKGDFSCKNFIYMLKLGLYNVDVKDIDKLDNYIYSYDLDNTSFYLPFTFNPGGNKKYFTKQDEADLKRLNTIKNDLVAPLKYLLENTINEDNKTEILKCLYTYLSEEGIISALLEKDYEGALKLVNAFDVLHDNLSTNASLIEIISLLSKLDFASLKNVSMQDEVTISSLSNALYEGKKFIYVIGAVNGNIPGLFSVGGLLSKNDVKESYLVSLINQKNDLEDYYFKLALENDSVVITLHKLGLDLKLNEPTSYLKLLNKTEIMHDKIYDKKLLLNSYASLLSGRKIKWVFEHDFEKINYSFIHKIDYKLKKETVDKLYNGDVFLSPSSIEAYAKCPFYYFCMKNLNLNVKEKYTFDNREIGTFIHFVLERILKNEMDNITIKTLDDYIFKYAKNYLEENNKIINKTAKYVIKKLSKNVSLVIKNIMKEMDVTKFKPRYFEFKVGDEEVIKPLSIDFNNGTLKVSGVIDRVDVYEDKENYYYRVIDYKTGIKKFRLDDVLMGLNLQMLIYLLAIKEGNVTEKKVIPSGFLYYPALVKEVSASRGLEGDEKELLIRERLRMNGMISKEKDVLNLYDDEEIGNFISVMTRGKLNEESLFDKKHITLLFDSVKSTLSKIGEEIKIGNISANPIGGRINACSYCNFKDVCKFDSKLDIGKLPLEYKNSEVLKKLEGDKND